MPYKINYKKENDYIEITIEGNFGLSILKELAADVSRLVKKHGRNRILNDIRLATLVKGAFDIYNMPRSANQVGVENRCKRALLVREKSSDFDFLEIVFLNQGHNVKLFNNIEKAMSWLLY